MVSFKSLATLVAISFAVSTGAYPVEVMPPCDTNAVSKSGSATVSTGLPHRFNNPESAVKKRALKRRLADQKARRQDESTEPSITESATTEAASEDDGPAFLPLASLTTEAEAEATATGSAVAQPSGCRGRTGYIRAHEAGSSRAEGPWISRVLKAFGEYGTTTDFVDALKVTLCAEGAETSTLNIWAPGEDLEDIPFLGGISGAANTDDNLSASSSNFAYLGSTVRVADGSRAISGDNSFYRTTGDARNMQSSVWTVGEDDSVAFSWVNTDGQRVNADIVRVIMGEDDMIVFTVGYTDFVALFGPSPIWSLTFEEEVMAN